MSLAGFFYSHNKDREYKHTEIILPNKVVLPHKHNNGNSNKVVGIKTPITTQHILVGSGII